MIQLISRWKAIPSTVKWAIVLLVALALRLVMLRLVLWDNPDGDAAVAGLMAKHIAEGRALPVFYYGQAYFGALEAYLNAILFFLFGFSPNLIFVLPLLFSMSLIGAAFLFARALFDARTATLSAVVMAIGPGALLLGNLSAGGGFALALLLQLVALWLFGLVYFRQEYDRRALLGFCFVSGLACWVWQIYIPVFFVLVALIARGKVRVNRRDLILGVGLFLVASSPLWFYNLQNGGATFMQGVTKVTGTDTQADLLSTLEAVIANDIEHRNALLLIWLKAPGGGNPLLSGILLLGLGLNWRQFRIQTRERSWQLSPAAFCLVLAALYFLIGNTTLHYLYILLPLLLPPAFQGWQSWRRVPVGLILTAMLLTNLYTVWTLTRANMQHPDWADTISQLEASNLKYGYSDYWNAYPLIFLSDEKIIVSPRLTTYGGKRKDRYPSYTTEVERAETVFVLAPDNSPDNAKVEQLADGVPHKPPLQSIFTAHGVVYFPLLSDDALRQWLSSLKPS